MANKFAEVASYFFKLGIFAFGGPAAHIAMMQHDLVKERKWMSEQSFLDLIGLTSLIPGPNSTEMTMHSGYSRAGVGGLFIGGICFIIPAVALTLLAALFYQNSKDLSYVVPFITGLKIAVLIIIGQAVIKLGRKCFKRNIHYILGVLALGLYILGISEVALIFGMGFIGILFYGVTISKDTLTIHVSFLAFLPLFFMAVKTASQTIFFTFLKIGFILFGSGYVLFAYLDGELVQNMELLTRSELLDAIAIGQFTPGPVLSTATFVGYLLDGYMGALAATLGIFLPSFFFVWLVYPLKDKMRSSALLSHFLDAVNIAALALMLAVSLKMGKELLVDWNALATFGIVLAAFYQFKKLGSISIVLIGALVFSALHFIAVGF